MDIIEELSDFIDDYVSGSALVLILAGLLQYWSKKNLDKAEKLEKEEE